MRKNCWEYKQCGRDGAGNVNCNPCPAFSEARLHGIHGGTNAGRACWVVAGTHCGGTVQGTFAQKYIACNRCDFYLDVQQQESPEFRHTIELWEILTGIE